ncbi:DNA topology modulation protein [Fusibacter paucivorans]|uniref:DNA topology modulation protein n=1 Tax=Fusibacter paucivorans TaxID=76009 RepID=A0ABS5PRX7_9FIRM|nr:DNA topology modulation protein [Fusibacter paucivorans]MBS7527920.1 DNA topology modulation protein [Fusibacter paucivorans]
MKIAVLGYSGSGKSTLSAFLGDLYHIPVLHLDTVQFKQNWHERDRDEALAMVDRFMTQDDWVIDGNYSGFAQAERLQMADTIIYMNFSRWQCLWRVWKRYRAHRNQVRPSMANGCIEKLDIEFIKWILFDGRSAAKRKHYAALLKRYAAKTIVLHNQSELDAYQLSVASKCAKRPSQPA